MPANFSGAKDWDYVQPPKYYPYNFELADLQWWQNTMIQYPLFPVYTSIVYLSLIFSIQKILKNRPAVDIPFLNISWNLVMALINFTGFLRQSQELAPILNKPDGFHRSLCVREELNLPAAAWGLYFCLSKYIFLGDTVLLALRKKPVLFIYWYHHVVAVTISWMIFPHSEPICRWIGSTNFFVLSIMYLYFALKAMDIKMPKSVGLSIAILHVLEMMAGSYMQFYTAKELFYGRPCARSISSIQWSLVPHVSLLFFFTKHLFNYVKQRKVKAL